MDSPVGTLVVAFAELEPDVSRSTWSNDDGRERWESFTPYDGQDWMNA